jgi:NAD(P)-dependent dehydrogenase (short-subunit alcohol dehydrogenase family)
MAGVMIVTGGSRGIGAATARLAARRGYKVCVNYVRDRAAGESLAREIGGIAVGADVAKEEDVLRLFREADKLGRLSVLVNNAGVVDVPARVDEMSLARLERMFAINITGAFLCAREAVKRMSTKRGGMGGVIVNVSSGAATRGSPNSYVWYAASKAALDAITLGLGLEVAGEGIRVVGMAAGVTETDIHTAAGGTGRLAQMAKMVPLGRVAQPDEMAEAILWLMSDAARYVTATTLRAGGGL